MSDGTYDLSEYRKAAGRSEPEDELAEIVRRAQLPAPVREHRFMTGRRFRFDFAWPDRRLAVEVQGGIGSTFQGKRSAHVDPDGYERDCEKTTLAQCIGWIVIPVTPRMISDGRALLLIKRGLRATGERLIDRSD